MCPNSIALAVPLVVDARDLDNARFAVGTDEDALIIEVPERPATQLSWEAGPEDGMSAGLSEDAVGGFHNDAPTPASWASWDGYPVVHSYPEGAISHSAQTFAAARRRWLRSMDSLWGSFAAGLTGNFAGGSTAVADGERKTL